jgi:hypothetical protein
VGGHHHPIPDAVFELIFQHATLGAE